MKTHLAAVAINTRDSFHTRATNNYGLTDSAAHLTSIGASSPPNLVPMMRAYSCSCSAHSQSMVGAGRASLQRHTG